MTSAIGLNFHGIGKPQRALESGEAPYWVSPEQFEYMLDQVANAPDPSVFEITFDDSNLSDHDIALPALVGRGLTARFFVLSGRIGQPGSLGAGHIKTLQRAGMVIGSHGIDHLVWPALDDTSLERELRVSRSCLEEICDHPVTEAGIPFGRYDARVLRALRSAGYSAAWSSDGGRFQHSAYLRPRSSLRGDMSEGMMQTLISGQLPPMRRLRRTLGMIRRRWMVTG